MKAVIKTGGKQYSVQAGQILKVEKLNGEKGDNISFNNVLAVAGSSDNIIGDPLIKGAKVEAKILNQIRDKKIIVFKKRKRKNSRSTRGHRQYLTVLQIESIFYNGKKSSAPKKEKKLKNENDKSNTLKKVEKKIEKKVAPKKKVVKKTATKKVTKKKTPKAKK